MGVLVAAASGLDACVPAPNALTVGQVSKLAGDLLAVWLVIAAVLPDEGASAFADMCAPCPELVVGCGCRRRFGVENILRVLLEQCIDGGTGAEVAGFGRSRPSGEDVDLVEVEQALRSRSRDDTALKVPVGTSEPARVRRPVRFQCRSEVGLAGAWCPVPGVPLVPALGRERAAVQLQLVLGQQILLEESGILRPAEVGEGFQQDFADGRAGPSWSHPGAGGAP